MTKENGSEFVGNQNLTTDSPQLALNQEIAHILSITPSASRYDRLVQKSSMADQYAQLRAGLQGASPLAIAELTKQQHRYATTEFDRRLDDGETFPLDYLLFRAQRLIGSGFKGSDAKLAARISAGIARYTPTAPVDEVVEAFTMYVRRIDADTTFLDEVLSYREDIDVIKEKLEEVAHASDDSEVLINEFDLEQRKQRAYKLRAERQQLTNSNSNQLGDEKFAIEDDTPDALRLEISAADPFNDHGVREYVTNIVEYLCNRYGDYLPRATIENLQTVPDRIYVVDSPSRAEIIDAWFADIEYNKPPYETAAEHVIVGDFILVDTPNKYADIWNNSSEEVKGSLISRFGSEENAIEVIGRERLRYALLHEVIHTLHPHGDRGSYEFYEIGTIYLTEQLSREFHVINFSDIDELIAGIYWSFVLSQEDPSVVNRAYFGLEEDPNIRQGLYTAFHEHVLKIKDLAKEHGRIAYFAPHMIGEDLSEFFVVPSVNETEQEKR